ncbi:DUF1294 domain-containing protein [Segatella copri]|uniref:DUF1294 domain-containing protein n=1 Tax=Segatella copri TaxID=165179 RepID=UPI003F8C9623
MPLKLINKVNQVRPANKIHPYNHFSEYFLYFCSIGAWMGMKVWHHKTMHKKFKLKNEVYEHYKEWDILEGHQAPDREIL